MSKKRKPGQLSGTQKKAASAYAAHKKAAHKVKADSHSKAALKNNSKKPGAAGGAGKGNGKGGKSTNDTPDPAAAKKAALQASQRPPPPFEKTDAVLLVGEGDFSFALSLKQHLGVKDIIATCYDDEATLLSKYPQAADHIAQLLAPLPPAERDPDEIYFTDDEEEAAKEAAKAKFEVHYGIDATALLKRRMFSKTKRKWDKIVFMFPHVGGITKDQNRQVRYNQELLLGFFKSAKPLLKETGNVIVGMFEGMPYELWEPKRLAKEAGLTVKTSFLFDAKDYVGYKHARTLGNVEGKGTAWKGEERKSRMFLFGVEAEWTVANRKKAKKDEDSDDD
ncbi:hypothetical protein BZA77DRAFT_9838 [Pyronema omphalodes]|nr:hypothetical protein BZA77DRAFT_9838 [Pyronema omphalodes]